LIEISNQPRWMSALTTAQRALKMSSCKRCFLLSMCLTFVALIVYIAVAIEGVEPTEYAIIRNNIS